MELPMFATRRALLGGLAALPLAGTFPAAARASFGSAAAEAARAMGKAPIKPKKR